MVKQSRGQLLLVAGVLVALVIVASAVLLNGLLVPQTATTSSLSTEANGIERTTNSIQSDLETLFEHTTSVDDPGAGVPLPYADSSDLDDEVAVYRSLARNFTANRSGAVVDVRYDDSRSIEGHAVFNQTVGQLRNGTHDDWTMARGVDAVERAHFTFVEEFATLRADGTTIVVEEDGGSSDWTLTVTNDAVFVDAGPPRCDAAINPGDVEQVHLDVVEPAENDATLSVTNASGATLCTESVDFGDGVARPWNVSIENGDEATGTYVLTVDDTAFVPSGPWPHVRTNVVIDPAFSVSYVSEGVTYESAFTLHNATR